MREIKFRAWDVVDGEMWEWPSLVQSGFKILVDPAYKIMQYTGLKDKNGKEIYEGDVLRSPKTEDVGPVVWDELDTGPGFIWRHPMMYMGQMDECEVIGNIYVNPELVAE
jgi:hypothetical protein